MGYSAATELKLKITTKICNLPIIKKPLAFNIKPNILEKKCLECGEKIIGRVDKKYCSDYCRNAYNNKVNKDSKNLIRNINNRLRKNYRVLDSFSLKEGKTKTTRTRLMDKGFDFEFITNLYTTKKGTTYYFVYDLGYLPLDNDYYMIVKRE